MGVYFLWIGKFSIILQQLLTSTTWYIPKFFLPYLLIFHNDNIFIPKANLLFWSQALHEFFVPKSITHGEI